MVPALPSLGACIAAWGDMCVSVVGSRWFYVARVALVLISCGMAAVWGVGPQAAYDACFCQPFAIPPSTNDDPTLALPPTFPYAVAGGACRSGADAAACAGYTVGGPLLLVWSEWLALTSSMLQALELAVLASAHSRSRAAARTTTAPATVPARSALRSSFSSARAAAVATPTQSTRASAAAAAAGGLLADSPASRMRRGLVASRLVHRLRPGWLAASGWNVLDAVVVAWNIVGSAAILAGARYSLGLGAADWFEAARALRFLRLFSLSARLRILVEPLASLARILASFVALFCAVTFSFAVVGVSVFGGASPPGQWCESCQPSSFATFPLAWLALIQITVGNNWNRCARWRWRPAVSTRMSLLPPCPLLPPCCLCSIMYPNLGVAGTWWAAVYFVLYRFFITDSAT